jgi:hypothetical protein
MTKFLKRPGVVKCLAFLRALVGLPVWLNWLLSVAEPLIVLAAAYVIGYATYYAVFTDQQWHGHIIATIKELNANWKAGIILLVILFYRTIRMFIEQAEYLWGVKKRLKGEPLDPVTLEPEERQ